MKNKSHLIVVESEVLPEVIIKVLEVKKLRLRVSVLGYREALIINTETVFILMKKSLCRKS